MAKCETKNVIVWDAGLTADGKKWVSQTEAEATIKEYKDSADNWSFACFLLGAIMVWVVLFGIILR